MFQHQLRWVRQIWIVTHIIWIPWCGLTYPMYIHVVSLWQKIDQFFFLFKKYINAINNSRWAAYGDDKFLGMEFKYGNKPKKDSFLMFLAYGCDNDGPQRVLGFALQFLMKIFRYKKSFLYIDRTLCGVPQGFYQVVIVSIMDQASGLHISFFSVQWLRNWKRHDIPMF